MSPRPEFLYRAGEIVPGTRPELKIVRPVGYGGMGSVYEVQEQSAGRFFVLKVVHPELLDGGSRRIAERMVQEAKVLASLEHDHIVQVYWTGVTEPTTKLPALPYIVMEKLNGRSLRHVLANTKERAVQLPIGFVLNTAAQLFLALAHAHGKGIIHRDVKPENVFVHIKSDATPVTKLIDFGISAVLQQRRRSEEGMFLGTFRYAAPEQLGGDTLTDSVDLYAAGLVLYEMLAGRGPFDDFHDDVAIAHAHLRTPAPSVSKWVEVLPAFDPLIGALLEKNPNDRPKSATEVVKVLRRIQTELNDRASDVSPGELPELDPLRGPLSMSNVDEAFPSLDRSPPPAQAGRSDAARFDPRFAPTETWDAPPPEFPGLREPQDCRLNSEPKDETRQASIASGTLPSAKSPVEVAPPELKHVPASNAFPQWISENVAMAPTVPASPLVTPRLDSRRPAAADAPRYAPPTARPARAAIPPQDALRAKSAANAPLPPAAGKAQRAEAGTNEATFRTVYSSDSTRFGRVSRGRLFLSAAAGFLFVAAGFGLFWLPRHWQQASLPVELASNRATPAAAAATIAFSSGLAPALSAASSAAPAHSAADLAHAVSASPVAPSAPLPPPPRHPRLVQKQPAANDPLSAVGAGLGEDLDQQLVPKKLRAAAPRPARAAPALQDVFQ